MVNSKDLWESSEMHVYLGLHALRTTPSPDWWRRVLVLAPCYRPSSQGITVGAVFSSKMICEVVIDRIVELSKLTNLEINCWQDWPQLKLESDPNHTSICQVMHQEPSSLIPHPCSMNLLQCKSRIWTTSECHLQLENTKDLSPIAQPDHTNGNIRFAHYYKVVEQECKNVSFINNLNFKNIAGLRGLNFECFSDEVYACIEESSLSALPKMIQAFVDIYGHSLPEGFMSWQDVYKYYILSSLSALEAKATTDFSSRTPECI
ncbi:hypothetical protein KIW84_055416 [Lathyrus oleraceus]|uniref:Uncharacterized protein n=1 Tax=Pisum sativum TaxID=3888 RepID=A0A9D4X0A3_PEA|nr:hypothetical protein KIW84_055416 [Pisum sativum]